MKHRSINPGIMVAPSNPPCSQDQAALQRVVNDALQTRSVHVENVPGCLYRTYRLRTHSGFFYILKSRPTNHTRLLRHEEERLQLEASTLHVLSGRPDVIMPRLIESPNPKAQRGSLHLISGPFAGSILSNVESSLSRSAMAKIEHSLGDYVRRLSSIRGSQFGTIQPRKTSTESRTWGWTFAAMLETVIRDAEDALISLPYYALRELTRKHMASLDKVTDPRLVILDAVADNNVVVDLQSNRVTGLIDFSSAIWGDPFISDAFYRPTSSFVEGFGRFSSSDAHQLIRQYLYVVYHTLLTIVRQFYRPSEYNQELEARRALTSAMHQLSAAGAS